MSDDFVLIEVSTPEWLERIARLRVEVWDLHGMVDLSYFPDKKCLEEADQIATHRIVEWEGRLIAAARYSEYPDLASTHLADYYRQADIDLPGPIGIPEHKVVHPDFAGRGLGKAIAACHLQYGIDNGIRYEISENSPANAEIMRKQGRKSLGMAPPDPRFPGIEYEWMVLDVEHYRRELEGRD